MILQLRSMDSLPICSQCTLSLTLEDFILSWYFIFPLFVILNYLRYGRIDNILRGNSERFLKSTKIVEMGMLKGLRGKGMVK